ncbi:hypothetical protein J1605_005906 [Eschrichtius robustus]|uniref:Uncharacterized protein n=1 Tax=Eschrichtius robustus TaxID=9764 RepID=A0AB34H2X4_ESCRO|nr:hypothetical protein J1605_005906 [Eschrichtius robustus]
MCTESYSVLSTHANSNTLTQLCGSGRQARQQQNLGRWTNACPGKSQTYLKQFMKNRASGSKPKQQVHLPEVDVGHPQAGL